MELASASHLENGGLPSCWQVSARPRGTQVGFGGFVHGRVLSSRRPAPGPTSGWCV